MCEQIVGFPASQLVEHFCARCAEHFVAVPVPLYLKENEEVLDLVSRVQFSERSCEQVLESKFHKLLGS